MKRTALQAAAVSLLCVAAAPWPSFGQARAAFESVPDDLQLYEIAAEKTPAFTGTFEFVNLLRWPSKEGLLRHGTLGDRVDDRTWELVSADLGCWLVPGLVPADVRKRTVFLRRMPGRPDRAVARWKTQGVTVQVVLSLARALLVVPPPGEVKKAPKEFVQHIASSYLKADPKTCPYARMTVIQDAGGAQGSWSGVMEHWFTKRRVARIDWWTDGRVVAYVEGRLEGMGGGFAAGGGPPDMSLENLKILRARTVEWRRNRHLGYTFEKAVNPFDRPAPEDERDSPALVRAFVPDRIAKELGPDKAVFSEEGFLERHSEEKYFKDKAQYERYVRENLSIMRAFLPEMAGTYDSSAVASYAYTWASFWRAGESAEGLYAVARFGGPSTFPGVLDKVQLQCVVVSRMRNADGKPVPIRALDGAIKRLNELGGPAKELEERREKTLRGLLVGLGLKVREPFALLAATSEGEGSQWTFRARFSGPGKGEYVPRSMLVVASRHGLLLKIDADLTSEEVAAAKLISRMTPRGGMWPIDTTRHGVPFGQPLVGSIKTSRDDDDESTKVEATEAPEAGASSAAHEKSLAEGSGLRDASGWCLLALGAGLVAGAAIGLALGLLIAARRRMVGARGGGRDET